MVLILFLATRAHFSEDVNQIEINSNYDQPMKLIGYVSCQRAQQIFIQLRLLCPKERLVSDSVSGASSKLKVLRA